jgi:hypothetical protein
MHEEEAHDALTAAASESSETADVVRAIVKITARQGCKGNFSKIYHILTYLSKYITVAYI